MRTPRQGRPRRGILILAILALSLGAFVFFPQARESLEVQAGDDSTPARYTGGPATSAGPPLLQPESGDEEPDNYERLITAEELTEVMNNPAAHEGKRYKLYGAVEWKDRPLGNPTRFIARVGHSPWVEDPPHRVVVGIYRGLWGMPNIFSDDDLVMYVRVQVPENQPEHRGDEELQQLVPVTAYIIENPR